MKQHTIIIVPHERAKFRKLRVTTLQAWLAIATLTVLTVGGLAASVSYFTNAVDREQLRRIEGENTALREVNQSFESSIRELEHQLEDYQERIHKLAIVAGLAELSPNAGGGLEAGIGGMPPQLDGMAVEPDELTESLVSLRERLGNLGQGMSLLQTKLDERHLLISSTPAISPVKGLMTSGFGFRKDPFTGRRAFHNGLDIVAPPGREVAPCSWARRRRSKPFRRAPGVRSAEKVRAPRPSINCPTFCTTSRISPLGRTRRAKPPAPLAAALMPRASRDGARALRAQWHLHQGPPEIGSKPRPRRSSFPVLRRSSRRTCMHSTSKSVDSVDQIPLAMHRSVSRGPCCGSRVLGGPGELRPEAAQRWLPGARRIRSSCIMPTSSCVMMWQCATKVPVMAG